MSAEIKTGDAMTIVQDADGKPSVTVTPKPTKSLSLYHLSSDLTDMIELRMEMVEAQEDTSEIDKQLTAYFAALPDKVDAVAHVLRHMEAQEELATTEIHRLTARRRSFASERERLEGYVKDVIAAMPPPRKGKVKKLPGKTATLELWPNGGLAPLDIQDPGLVPDEYCTAKVTMPWSVWSLIVSMAEASPSPGASSFIKEAISAVRDLDNDAIRKALDEPCWDCSGSGLVPEVRVGDENTPSEYLPSERSVSCPACGGTGKNGVPGCSLRERGVNLRIK